MLTVGQQKFLDSLDKDALNRVVEIKPWNPRALDVANQIIAQIRAVVPDLEINLTGSLAYGIAGEQDIDISVYCSKSEQLVHCVAMEKIFGKPTHVGGSRFAWDFERDGFHVGVWLVDPELSPSAKASLKMAEVFKNKPALIKECEQIKLHMNGKTYKEYQTAKYEFYNKILGISNN